jgi:ribosomal protein L7/L12
MDDQKLQNYFKFDDADLQANQMGRFSAKQKARLAGDNQYSRKWSLIGGILLVLFALVGPGLAVIPWANNMDLISKIGFTLGFGIIWPVFSIWVFNGGKLFKRAFYAHEYKLAKVEGSARVLKVDVTVEHRLTSHYEMHIGGQKFLVASLVSDVIIQGDEYEYVVYFVADPDKIPMGYFNVKDYDAIMSVEALPMAKDRPLGSILKRNLVLINAGANRLETIKVIRQLTGMDYVDAEKLSELPSGIVIKDVDENIGRQAISQFEKVGARAEIVISN